jgi:2-hydroxychromene-2-carboxylate isomerase
MHACWERGADLNDVSVLKQVTDDAGLSELQLSTAADLPEIKTKLVVATDAAIKAGIFGVPTFVLDGELFWGSDRINALLWRLDHPNDAMLDGDLLQEFLQRGASAQRRLV